MNSPNHCEVIDETMASVDAKIASCTAFLLSLWSFVERIFLSVLEWLYKVLGSVVGDEPTWEQLYSSVPFCNDVTIVTRVQSAHGMFRVEGFIIIEKYGKVHRLLLDGSFVQGGSETEDASKGDKYKGAILLPDSVPWKLTNKSRVRSANSDMRGALSLLEFDTNPTGIKTIQVTMIRNNREGGKHAISVFQDVLHGATMSANAVSAK